MRIIDFGKLTEDDTVEVAKEALRNLTDENLYAVLNDVLTPEQKGECAAAWEDKQ
jgi:hypothetical protein